MWGVIVGSTWSPDSTMPSAGSNRHRWSLVWPGVCSDTHSRPASSITSASSTRWVGAGVFMKPLAMRRMTFIRARRFHGGRGPTPSTRHGTGWPQGLPLRGCGRAGAVESPWSLSWSWLVVVVRVGLRVRVGHGGELGGLLVLRRVEPGPEAAVRHDAGAVLLAEPPGAAEVVGVRVGDDDRVDVRRLVVRLLQPLHQGPPGLRAREPRVDDGDAALVLQEVAVHVAEAGQEDRQLRPEDVRGHLGDLGGGRLLFLAARARGRGGHGSNLS